MGYLKDVHSNLDIQAFPGAQFEIAGDVPTPQCSEARIEGDDASTSHEMKSLTDPNAFVGFDLIGKICHIVTNPGGETGDFPIHYHSGWTLEFLTSPGNGGPTVYYITDGGELILTRNVKSFAQFIHAAGYAYTIKGGKLYTSMPSNLLKNACTILFDPLT